MLQSFPRLHDSDDGSLNQQLTIFFNVLVSHLNLLLLLSLHGDVYVDSELLVLVAVEEADDCPVFQVVLVHAFVLQHKQLGLEQNLKHLQN